MSEASTDILDFIDRSAPKRHLIRRRPVAVVGATTQYFRYTSQTHCLIVDKGDNFIQRLNIAIGELSHNPRLKGSVHLEESEDHVTVTRDESHRLEGVAQDDNKFYIRRWSHLTRKMKDGRIVEVDVRIRSFGHPAYPTKPDKSLTL